MGTSLGPCFSGCLVGTAGEPPAFCERIFVSVLVLVDVWWVRTVLACIYRKEFICLGPCFSGCLVGTKLDS